MGSTYLKISITNHQGHTNQRHTVVTLRICQDDYCHGTLSSRHDLAIALLSSMKL